MANIAFNVIGLLIGAVGIFALKKDFFATKESANTNVQLHVGLAEDDASTGG